MRGLSLAILLALRTAHAEPLAAGLGLEGGRTLAFHWVGAVAELEVRITEHFALRATGRWQSFGDGGDECDLLVAGRQLDAAGGVRWSPVGGSGRWTVRPSVSLVAGGATQRFANPCSSSPPTTRTSWIVEPALDLDVRMDDYPALAFRFELRGAYAPDLVSDERDFHAEISLAVLAVARL